MSNGFLLRGLVMNNVYAEKCQRKISDNLYRNQRKSRTKLNVAHNKAMVTYNNANHKLKVKQTIGFSKREEEGKR